MKDYAPEQLGKLARAINERRGYSVKQTDGWFELMLSGKNAGYFSNTGGDNAWLNAPRVCTDREAAKVALEEWVKSGENRWWEVLMILENAPDIYNARLFENHIHCMTNAETEALAISLALASVMGIDVEAVTATEKTP